MFRSTNTQRGTNGFTMTEMLTVVILMGAVSAVIVPQFGGNTEQYAQTAARSISQDIQYAQDLAVTTQSPITLSIPSGYEYSLQDIWGTILTHPINHKPYSVNFQDDPDISQLTMTADFGGSTKVVFDAFGTPSTGGTITLSHSSMTSDVVLTLHAATGSVTVSQAP
jgi:prepilin-type N-terminal cleavage/methylation domain-containing protein